MQRTIEKELSFSKLTVTVQSVGDDFYLVLSGGDKPHIGCCVLAVPRQSLTGDGSISSTASVINVTGHKDEYLCRYLAEAAAIKKNAVTVCTGGFHMDHILPKQIEEVMAAVREISDML